MAVLSRDAQAILDRYLDRLRGSLRGHASIDVEDVERDVQSHIESALAGEPEPIDARSIRQVLDGLGAPEQWVSSDDLPTWRSDEPTAVFARLPGYRMASLRRHEPTHL